jgi:hypothetical protein
MEDAADAEFFGGSCDRVIHLTHAHELKHLHPVAQVMEHQHALFSLLTTYASAWGLHDNLHDNGGLTSRSHADEHKENHTHCHL